MTNPKGYILGAKASIENVDLDDEVVTVQGKRLTEAGAEQLARSTLAEARRHNLIPGRKSLTTGTTHPPPGDRAENGTSTRSPCPSSVATS